MPAKPAGGLDHAPGEPWADPTPPQVGPATTMVVGLVDVDLAGTAPAAGGHRANERSRKALTLASRWAQIRLTSLLLIRWRPLGHQDDVNTPYIQLTGRLRSVAPSSSRGRAIDFTAH